ncbi:hypothetical protein ACJ72_01546 [Emergomyces africanus]|uniref:Uncharacterized protein n=1 Tax=Emergomyces africanus TaxID=1955775 RepID=A0A1B7P529_9EURO|nr:hypothetical protein ACJ72_01546 [Emergomyces africanus]
MVGESKRYLPNFRSSLQLYFSECVPTHRNFLPSPSHTFESIRDILLGNIREVYCAWHLPDFKSLCEGRTNSFWDKLGREIHAAQRIGLVKDGTASMLDMDEVEKENATSNIIRDNLDNPATLGSCLCPERCPVRIIRPDVDDTQGLDEFTERILQARLANFWKGYDSSNLDSG